MSDTAMTPAPTRDIDTALADLNSFGACVLEGVLQGDKLAEVQAALCRAAETDRRYGLSQDYAYGSDDHLNQRIWNLPSHDPVFCELAENPVAMTFVNALLGWPALLSSMSANIISEGGQSMVIHCDQGYMPPPWSRPLGVNVAWCIDDFTAENGATVIAPGSNGWEPNTYPPDVRERLVPIEAPAGSVVVMEGRLVHTNGINTNGARRAGIFSWYTLPVYLPQENWYRSLNPAVQQVGSETLMTLLGFRPQVLGRVNGRDGL
jgi:ectoine hydroxylase-related dioxygenase (phytanoyl-CoA dioxygenase family)